MSGSVGEAQCPWPLVDNSCVDSNCMCKFCVVALLPHKGESFLTHPNPHNSDLHTYPGGIPQTVGYFGSTGRG